MTTLAVSLGAVVLVVVLVVVWKLRASSSPNLAREAERFLREQGMDSKAGNGKPPIRSGAPDTRAIGPRL